MGYGAQVCQAPHAVCAVARLIEVHVYLCVRGMMVQLVYIVPRTGDADPIHRLAFRTAAPAIGQIVLFRELLANVEALNVCTMALLVFFLARPQSGWIRWVAGHAGLEGLLAAVYHCSSLSCSCHRCALFIFLEALVVGKILFQLPLINGHVPLSVPGTARPCSSDSAQLLIAWGT